MNQYQERSQRFSNGEIVEGKRQRYGKSGSRNVSPQWTPELDKKYGVSLMGESGIDRMNGASIVRNIGNQYADSIDENAPTVIRNANTRRETMRGLLNQAKQARPEIEDDEPRAQVRQRRQSFKRQPERYQRR